MGSISEYNIKQLPSPAVGVAPMDRSQLAVKDAQIKLGMQRAKDLQQASYAEADNVQAKYGAAAAGFNAVASIAQTYSKAKAAKHSFEDGLSAKALSSDMSVRLNKMGQESLLQNKGKDTAVAVSSYNEAAKAEILRVSDGIANPRVKSIFQGLASRVYSDSTKAFQKGSEDAAFSLAQANATRIIEAAAKGATRAKSVVDHENAMVRVREDLIKYMGPFTTAGNLNKMVKENEKEITKQYLANSQSSDPAAALMNTYAGKLDDLFTKTGVSKREYQKKALEMLKNDNLSYEIKAEANDHLQIMNFKNSVLGDKPPTNEVLNGKILALTQHRDDPRISASTRAKYQTMIDTTKDFWETLRTRNEADVVFNQKIYNGMLNKVLDTVNKKHTAEDLYKLEAEVDKIWIDGIAFKNKHRASLTRMLAPYMKKAVATTLGEAPSPDGWWQGDSELDYWIPTVLQRSLKSSGLSSMGTWATDSLEHIWSSVNKLPGGADRVNDLKDAQKESMLQGFMRDSYSEKLVKAGADMTPWDKKEPVMYNEGGKTFSFNYDGTVRVLPVRAK